MIGPTLGSYELREEIGRGGMAVVYRAYQPNVDRDVAIKVISKDLGRDPEAIERFQREARLIARLEHPHILPVHDFDGGHEPPYIVMRYLVGGSLSDLIEKNTLTLDEVADLFSQVCSSIDYAHRQGIVHRDIKPSNILIDLEGHAFVSDFGIAKMVAGGNGGYEITGAGAFIGTPKYMAPEQITGDQVDQRADIYALGVLLFQMTTGRLPFKADNPVTILTSHLQGVAPSALQYNPDLPAQIDEVIFKAMAKDREDRYSSAANLAEAVSAAIVGSRTKGSDTGLTSKSISATQTIQRVRVGQAATTWTPIEQKRNITALYANAAEYVTVLDKIFGSETARQHLEEFWRKVEDRIISHGGRTITRTGDALLALWGMEFSREHDAERAVSAALSILEIHQGEFSHILTLEGDDRDVPLGIGVNTGMALLVPEDGYGGVRASGATPSIANRLAQEADSTVLISQSTYSQVRGIFHVSQHSQLKMRYFTEPVQTYKVTGTKPTAFRILTRGIEGIETRMIGREAELQILRNAYLDAIEDAETQVITIVSEAGLGKSRLLYEFSNWAELRSEQYWLFGSRPTPEMIHRPYALLRDLLSIRFGILDSDKPDDVRRKLETGIEKQIGVRNEIAPVLGQLAGFDFSNNRLVKGLLHEPKELANRGKQLFNDWIRELCAINPVVIELDDIHYADDASLDMLNDLVSQNDKLPLLVITLARDSLYERRPNWGRGLPNHTRIDLRPLDKRVSRGLVREILQKVESVPRVLRDLLVERAEGNPYYLEELVKMLIDQRIIIKDSDESWRVEAERLEYLPVPGTLNGLLQSSLDGLLYPERLTLERAAVIGRVFYSQALGAIDWGDMDHVQDLDLILQSLVNREDIHQRELSTFIDSDDYLFRSKMLGDMVLNTIPEFRLKRYHRAVADWFVQASAGRAEEFSDRIAYHYSSAGKDEWATDWYLRAAERAASQGAFPEARKYFDEALDSNKGKDLDKKWQALLGRYRVLAYVGDMQARMAVEEEIMALAKETENQAYLAEAQYRRGYTAFDMGEFRTAIDYLDAALDAAENGGKLKIAASALSLKVLTQTRLGETEEAFKTAEEALAIAEELGDEYLLAKTLNNTSSLYSYSGDREGAITMLGRQVEICHRLNIQIGEANALLNLGYENILLGLYEQGRDALERSLVITENIGARQIGAYIQLNLGLAYTRLGAVEKALEYLLQAGSVLNDIGDTFGQAASKLYIGYAYEVAGEVQEATDSFTEAARMLSEIGVPGMAIDAQAGIGRCLLLLNDLEEAKKEITKVWDQLTEQGAQGVEFPILAYLTCANGFMIFGDGELSRKAIVDGKEMLDQWADKIKDEEWRFAYLNNFPEHVAIQAMYDEVAPT